MDEYIKIMLIGSFGAFVQELMYWHGLRTKILPEKYATLLKSKFYWIVTFLFIVSSGLVTLIWCYEEQMSLRTYFIIGMAIPLIVKQAVKNIKAIDGLHFGEESNKKHSFTIQDYFS